MSETKTQEKPPFAPLADAPEDNLPEPVALTAEQIVAQAEAEERNLGRQLESETLVQLLRNDAMGVTRAMQRFRHENEQAQIERVLGGYETGSFLLDRLGAGCALDQDLTIVLLALRRRLTEEHGNTPAATMLIDRAVIAYRDLLRITGWTGNLALLVEAEFFGSKGPRAHFRDRNGREGRVIRGLTVEQHIARLREGLIPLAERCGRVMREALGGLEMLRAAPSHAVERSRPIRISLKW